MIDVLWLASWYPGRTDAFNGDFIERHAKAASLFTKLTVLVVIKDETLPLRKVDVEKTVTENLTVYKIYYGKTGWGGLVEKIFSGIRYFWLQKKIYRQLLAENKKPALVHVQVAMKAGLFACWLKRKYGIPFIVTEHWTGYYPQSKPSLCTANSFFKNSTKKILQQAQLLLPVSNDLGLTINKNVVAIPYQVIPNVVDTSLFFYKPKPPGLFRFVHASHMNYQKNPEGILQACQLVKTHGYDFELLMIGNQPASLLVLCNEYGLDENVQFIAAIPYAAVATEMQLANALILFSRFENLPCIILEALCCGLPVISSRVGGVAEILNEQNGLLVVSEHVNQLADAMIEMMKNYNNYNQMEIALAAAEKFNYHKVGSSISTIYGQVLSLT